jgi:hypothetical protein
VLGQFSGKVGQIGRMRRFTIMQSARLLERRGLPLLAHIEP